MNPIALGSRCELFVDPYLIDTLTDAHQHLHEPVRKETVFRVQEPLENACTGCFNLVQVDGKILVYYRGYHPTGKHEDLPDGWAETQTANLLVSDDGIHFERPSLGLVDVEGSKDNNLIIRGSQAHNFCVFLDGNPSVPPEQRYKAIGGEGMNRLFGFSSSDGLVWKSIHDGPLDITGAFDSVNVPFWDDYEGCYRIFSRYFELDEAGERIRAIQSCKSDDFIQLDHTRTSRVRRRCPYRTFLHQRHHALSGGGAYPGVLSHAIRAGTEEGYGRHGLPGRRGLRRDIHGEQGRRPLGPYVYGSLAAPRTGTAQLDPPQPDAAVGLFPTAPDEWSLYVAEHYGWDTNGVRRVTVRPHGFARSGQATTAANCSPNP